MNDTGWNMYVFRDGRKSVRGQELTDELRQWLDRAAVSPTEDRLLGALISAGELECALADAGSQSARTAEDITDQLADSLVRGSAPDGEALRRCLAILSTPESVSVSVAEGFAYYALHPFRFETPVRQIAAGVPVRVVGLRSIGTTLSAVVQALFRKSGIPSQRLTVRPTGHPYDRQLALSSAERAWVRNAEPDAMFIVVDEGPGLSGSSFLSVAEAIESAGIPPSRILMLGSRCPDPSQLHAPNAAQRWSRYRFLAADPQPVLPADASIDLTSGFWRHHFWQDFDHQPAAWAHLELAKYLNKDRGTIYKFHGYGHFAEAITSRAESLSGSGYSPRFLGMDRGFGKYEVVQGALLSGDDIGGDLLRRAAEYCAFRRRGFPVDRADSTELANMTRWNWQCEFGAELTELNLPVEAPVVADGRMLPHEWIRTDTGSIKKLDATTHGDDHFFPGPCDIAWDLAGMIVEWELDGPSQRLFLESYRDLSGDNAAGRVEGYILSYAVFRMAWSKMAAAASAGMFDEKLLLRDYVRYRAQAIAAHEQLASVKTEEIPRPANLKQALAF